MSLEKVCSHLEKFGFKDRVIVTEKPSPTVETAAIAVGCLPAQIAKTISLQRKEGALLIVAAGDAKIDNAKFKHYFHEKPKMIQREVVEDVIGHAPGGVCPFAIKDGVPVYLDISLQRFEIVYPAAGTDHSAVKLTPEELFTASSAKDWVDVCKNWE